MTMTPERLAELDAVMATVTAAFPITSRDTADYAEITFGSSQTQAMSMEPATLLAINDVFAAIPDLRAHIEAQGATIARLETEMRALIRGYVSLMETGRDRIIGLGGKCDSMERMEGVDPYLRAARAALTGAA